MGKGSNTQTTNQFSSYTPAYLGGYENLLSQANNVAGLPYVPYAGEMVSPENAQELMGVAGINANAQNAAPYFNTAGNLAYQGAQPLSAQEIASYYSPYQSQVVNSTIADMNNLNAQQQQQVLGNAISQNALGGNRTAVAQANLAGQQSAQEAPILANLENQGYSNALATAASQYQTNPLQASYLLGNLGTGSESAGLQGAAAQFGAGQQEQQIGQALDAAEMAQFQAEQGFPFAELGYLSGITQGIAPLEGGTTIGQSQTTGPAPNPTGSILGGLSLLAALKRGGRVSPHDPIKARGPTGLVHEHRDTLKAQQQQLITGRRPVQMFPAGRDELPLPRGMDRVSVGRDVFHYNPRQINPDKIRLLAMTGRQNLMLGLGPLSKSEILARVQRGEHPVVIVERDPHGTEVRAAAATMETAPYTHAAMMRGKDPRNTLHLESPHDTLARRARGGKVSGVAGFGDAARFAAGGASGYIGDSLFGQGGSSYGDLGSYGYVPQLNLPGTSPPQPQLPGGGGGSGGGGSGSQDPLAMAKLVQGAGKIGSQLGNSQLFQGMTGDSSGDWAGGPDDTGFDGSDVAGGFDFASGGRIPRLATGGKATGSVGGFPGGSIPSTGGKSGGTITDAALGGINASYPGLLSPALVSFLGLNQPTPAPQATPAPAPTTAPAPTPAAPTTVNPLSWGAGEAQLGYGQSGSTAPNPSLLAAIQGAANPSASTAAAPNNFYAAGSNAALTGGYTPGNAGLNSGAAGVDASLLQYLLSGAPYGGYSGYADGGGVPHLQSGGSSGLLDEFASSGQDYLDQVFGLGKGTGSSPAPALAPSPFAAPGTATRSDYTHGVPSPDSWVAPSQGPPSDPGQGPVIPAGIVGTPNAAPYWAGQGYGSQGWRQPATVASQWSGDVAPPATLNVQSGKAYGGRAGHYASGGMAALGGGYGNASPAAIAALNRLLSSHGVHPQSRGIQRMLLPGRARGGRAHYDDGGGVDDSDSGGDLGGGPGVLDLGAAGSVPTVSGGLPSIETANDPNFNPSAFNPSTYSPLPPNPSPAMPNVGGGVAGLAGGAPLGMIPNPIASPRGIVGAADSGLGVSNPPLDVTPAASASSGSDPVPKPVDYTSSDNTASDGDVAKRTSQMTSMAETGKLPYAGAGNISPDAGHSYSYGIYGLNSRTGSAASFAGLYGDSFGLTAQPGTAEFNRQWKAAAAANPQGFGNAQYSYFEQHIWPLAMDSLNAYGVPDSLKNDPRVQQYMADRFVQMGTVGLRRSMTAAGYDPDNRSVPDQPAGKFIRAISAADADNVHQDFKTYLSDNPGNVRGLLNRIALRQNGSLNSGDAGDTGTQVASAGPSGGSTAAAYTDEDKPTGNAGTAAIDNATSNPATAAGAAPAKSPAPQGHDYGGILGKIFPNWDTSAQKPADPNNPGFGTTGILAHTNWLGLDPDTRRTLMNFGIGALQNKSPFLANAIGEGGAYANNRDDAVKQLQLNADKARAEIARETAQTEGLRTSNQQGAIELQLLKNALSNNPRTGANSPYTAAPPNAGASPAPASQPSAPAFGPTSPVVGPGAPYTSLGVSPAASSGATKGVDPSSLSASPPSNVYAQNPNASQGALDAGRSPQAPTQPPAPSAPTRTPGADALARSVGYTDAQTYARKLVGDLQNLQGDPGQFSQVLRPGLQQRQNMLMEQLKALNAAVAKDTEQTPEQKNALAAGYSNPADYAAHNKAVDNLITRSGKTYEGIHAASRQYESDLKPYLDVSRSILNDPAMYTGAGGQLSLDVDRIRTAFGNEKAQKAAMLKEALQKVTAGSVLSQINTQRDQMMEAGSNSGRIFSSQVDQVEKAAPQIATTLGGNRFLVEVASRMGEQQRAVDGMMRDYLKTHDYLTPEFDGMVSSYLRKNPIFTPQEISHPDLIGAPTVPPDAQNNQQVRNWAHALGLHDGDAIRTQSGQIRSVPRITVYADPNRVGQ